MTLRVGLVGTGYWAALNHAPLLARAPGLEFTTVWGRDEHAAARIAAGAGARAWSSFDEFLTQCDVVDLAVPPAVQGDLAVRAARAGKHLVLEKPIAGSLDQARELAEAVRGAGVVAVVGLTRRFHPRTRQFIAEARALANRAGVVGATGTFLHGGLLPGGFLPDDSASWRRAPDGALLDLGAHLIDLTTAALGPAVAVECAGGPLTTLTLTHASGARSQLVVSMSVAARPTDHRLRVLTDADVLEWTKDGIDDAQCWSEALDELCAAVATGAPVTAGMAEGLALQAALEAAGEALRTGRRTEVPAVELPL